MAWTTMKCCAVHMAGIIGRDYHIRLESLYVNVWNFGLGLRYEQGRFRVSYWL